MTKEPNNLVLIAVLVLPVLVCMNGYAQDRGVYRCVDSAGGVVFSDKECQGKLSKLNINTPTDAEMNQQKTEHDAKVSRDKVLADQVEARRLAQEQAARAEQDRQAQVNRALSDKVDQERVQRNSAVNSTPNVIQSAPTTTVPLY